MLTDRITLALTAELELEDYFSSALGVIFPGDITNQHGDPSTPVIYTSPTYGKIFLNLADPVGEESRKLFAQYLWNTGVYMAVALEDAVEGTVLGERLAGQEAKNTARERTRETGGDDSHHSAESLPDTQNDTLPPSSTLRPLTNKHATPQSPAATTSHKEKSPWDVRNESVLELGAGTGLAGIIAAKAGAKHVLITDYPAAEVLANLKANVERNLSANEKGRWRILGHEWGVVPDGDSCIAAEDSEGRKTVDGAADDHDEDEEHQTQQSHQKFTRVLVADCLWMPSRHQNLHRSISYYLSPASPLPSPPSATPHTRTTSGRALIVAGFHTGRAGMAPFFDERALAAAGLCLESIVERDAGGRERPWTWPRPRKGGGCRGGGGGGGGCGWGTRRAGGWRWRGPGGRWRGWRRRRKGWSE